MGGVGSRNSGVYRMVRTVAVWLILAEVAHTMSCKSTRIEAPFLRAKANFPLHECKAVHFIWYKLKASFMHKQQRFEKASGASQNVFEFTPSRTSKTDLFPMKTNITFIIDF